MVTDLLILEGMQFYGYHGANAAEKELGQRFMVDVEIEADLAAAGRTDDLEQTVNYAQVYKRVRSVVEGDSLNLIEAVAERVAGEVLALPRVQAVTVRVRKPWAPIKGSQLAAAAVQIRRESGATHGNR